MSYSKKIDNDVDRYTKEAQYLYDTAEQLFHVYFDNFSLLLKLPDVYDSYLRGYTKEITESILIYIHHYTKVKYIEAHEEIKKNCIILYYCAFLKNIIENNYVSCKNKSLQKTVMITSNKIHYQNHSINDLLQLSNNAWNAYLKTRKKIYLEDIYWYTRYIIQKQQNWNTSQIVAILNACHLNLKKCYKKTCNDKDYHTPIKEGGHRK